ncbi:hypothetical protein GCM10027161_46230 [Microbispora hainanensis]
MVKKHRAPSNERGSGPPIEMSGAVTNSKQDHLRARQLTPRNTGAGEGPPTFFTQIRPSELRVSQFPDVVHDHQGKITRPFDW